MQNYLSQFLSDLESSAANPPEPAYIEIHPHMKAVPDATEPALAPFKSISEWTGITSNVFPEMYHLVLGRPGLIPSVQQLRPETVYKRSSNLSVRRIMRLRQH
jgi:hypothetical protein